MGKLLAKLNEQQYTLTKQQEALKTADVGYARTLEYVKSTASPVAIVPLSATPVNDPCAIHTGEELALLKTQLEKAHAEMARMDQELAQNRITKHTIDQAIGAASEADFPFQASTMITRGLQYQPSHGGQNNLQMTREHAWATRDDSKSDTSDTLSAGGFNRARHIWSKHSTQATSPFQPTDNYNTQWFGRAGGPAFSDGSGTYGLGAFPGDRFAHKDSLMPPPARRHHSRGSIRQNNYSYPGSNSSFDGFGPSSYGSVSGAHSSMHNGVESGASFGNIAPQNLYSAYQPRPIGTPLSPHAPEFTSASWKSEVRSTLSLYHWNDD